MKKDKCLYTLAYHQKMRFHRRPRQYRASPVKRKLTLRRFGSKPRGNCA